MFWYDKDMERVMQHKKREILKELEETKCRILKELSGVDKVTLTRLREIIADYNRIDFNINNKVENLISRGNLVVDDVEKFAKLFEAEIKQLDNLSDGLRTLNSDLKTVEGEKVSNEEFNEVIAELENSIANLNETKANKTDLTTPFNFKGSTTFANLPTTNNNVNDTYYCTDLKKRFTWNGSEWFQSSLNEADYTDELSKLSEEIAEIAKESYNLFDKSKVKQGYYIRTTGEEIENPDFSYVFLPVKKGKKYICSGTNYHTVFIRFDGVVSGTDTLSNGEPNHIIDATGYQSELKGCYISFRHKVYDVNTYMCNEGTELLAYKRYGLFLNDEINITNENKVKDILFKNDIPKELKVIVAKDNSGDFTSLKESIDYLKTVPDVNKKTIILKDTSSNYKGTVFDIFSELGGQDYLNTITDIGYKGLVVPDNFEIIGEGKVKLTCYLPDTATLEQTTAVSCLEIKESVYLENLFISVKNCRYAVHDESSNKYPNKKHIYKNVIMEHLGNKSGMWQHQHAFGCGTSGDCDFEFENCIFDATKSTGYPFSIHNAQNQQGVKISLDGCVMKGVNSDGASLKFGYLGYSPATSYPDDYWACFSNVFIKNTISDGNIVVKKETNDDYSTNPFIIHNFTNIELVQQ